MKILSTLLPVAIGLEHVYIFCLETFLWETDRGRRTFGMTKQNAAATSQLAKNMGLYNGFLAAALLATTLVPEYKAMQLFPLGCVAIAGIFGGFTVSRRIFYVQGAPALIAIAAQYLDRW